ncbi:MAG TPA: TRAM domain-containing protein [Promineifilum sp.]|nr:TRAM domain-containing protein [Promineifilum sp.]HRO90738.1 TRAM domain-containing protein [Promineifilum sp.]
MDNHPVPELTLTLTDMAHGGLALGRDKSGRAIFVPFAIPDETVRVRVPEDKRGFARAELLEVLKPSPDRIAPRCRHFGICGNCHLQHMSYAAQLQAKEAAVRDQLTRVGGLKNPPLRPILPAPEPYGYRAETALFPAEGGGLGYWSPVERGIFRVEECPILQPALESALPDLDVELPGLRRLSLRLGDDEELLAALETEDVEPPELAVDFPVSVAIVLPDRTAASLIGDPYLMRTLAGREYRFSPGVAWPANPAAAELLAGVVLELAEITADDVVLESPGGAGWLTAALAQRAASVIAVEPNPDAVADAAENLDAFDNVSLYEGTEEEVFPALETQPDVVVLRPADGLSPAAFRLLERLHPRRRVVVTGEVGALAKDAKRLAKMGYRPLAFQPVDLSPQAFQVEIVSLWRK